MLHMFLTETPYIRGTNMDSLHAALACPIVSFRKSFKTFDGRWMWFTSTSSITDFYLLSLNLSALVELCYLFYTSITLSPSAIWCHY